MAVKSPLDVKHKRRKQKADAKRAGVEPPPPPKIAPRNPKGNNGLEKGQRRRLKTQGVNWDPIVERYVKGYMRPHDITGEMALYYPSVLEVATEFGLGPDTVSQRCTMDGWVAKREEWRAKLQKIKDEADLQALKEAELRIRRKALRAAEKIIDKVGGNEATIAMIDNADPGDLASLAGALRRSQEVANVAIGIPKDGVRPPSTDDPGGESAPITAWAQMRASRQEILVGVRISNE